jgi:hypothetical protein
LQLQRPRRKLITVKFGGGDVLKQSFEGSCHCQSVKFRASVDLAESIVCDCSICTMKGSILNRVEESDFELLTPLEELSLYTFNKHIAKHYFCPKCGVHPFNRPRSKPKMWAVNVRCLDGVQIDAVKPKPVFGSKLD